MVAVRNSSHYGIAVRYFMRAITGKDAEGNLSPYHLGHFFSAIDTEAFMGAEAFKKTAGDMLRDLRSSGFPLKNNQQILVSLTWVADKKYK